MNQSKPVIAIVILGLVMLGSPSTYASDRIAQIRSQYKELTSQIDKKTLVAHKIHFGQTRQRDYVIYYEDTTTEQRIADPYARHFAARRILQTEMLPAVGPVNYEYNYDSQGRIFFVLISGAATIPGWEFRPTDELRIYWNSGKIPQVIRTVFYTTDQKGYEKIVTINQGAAAPAQRTHLQAIQKQIGVRATQLYDAISAMGK